MLQAQSIQSGSGQNHRIKFTAVQFSQPRVNIATYIADFNVFAKIKQLSLSPRTARPDASPTRKFTERICCCLRIQHQRVANILSLWNRCDLQPIGRYRWQVLQAMNGEVNLTIEQRRLQTLGKNALPTNLGQRGLRLIALSLDRDQLDLVTQIT